MRCLTRAAHAPPGVTVTAWQASAAAAGRPFAPRAKRFGSSLSALARATLPAMPAHHRPRGAALVALVASVAVTACAALTACTAHPSGSGAPAVTPTTAASAAALTWPSAIDPAQADGAFYVVWTDVEEASQGAKPLQPEVAKLATLGYTTIPWDPSCQEHAAEQLTTLTSYAKPYGVGLAFASARDAGVFSTLYAGKGRTVSVTEGTYTCQK